MTFKKTIYRGHNNYNTETASQECTVKDFGPSLTVQSQAEDADINTIIQRFGLTGTMPDNPRIPTYQNFEDVFDYRTAITRIREADQAFMELTPRVRARFDNDPQAYMAFCADEKNRPEMKELGLLKPAVEVPKDPQGGVIEAIRDLKGSLVLQSTKPQGEQVKPVT